MNIEKLYPEWELVKKLGEGSFGAVYEIKKAGPFGDMVAHSALKIISIPKTDSDLEMMKNEIGDDHTVTAMLRSRVEDIIKEFQCMSQLKGHSNIVSYEDHKVVQQDNGMGWDVLIRMELLTPLLVRCKSGPLAEDKVIRLGIDMCRALELCQRFKIIHRDIKPQNIFVNDVGDFKLGDFGVAKIMEHTVSASVAGTHPYMAPEVYHGQPYNHTVDTYSLGLVLYWLLNEKRLPFEPLPPAQLLFQTREDALKRRMDGEPIPAPAHGSPALKAIVQKACEYDPHNRFLNANQMRQALEQLRKPETDSDLDNTKREPWDDDTSEVDEEVTIDAKEAVKKKQGTETPSSEATEPKPIANPAPPEEPDSPDRGKKKSRSKYWATVAAALIVLIIAALHWAITATALIVLKISGLNWAIAAVALIVLIISSLIVRFRKPTNAPEGMPQTAKKPAVQTQPTPSTTGNMEETMPSIVQGTRLRNRKTLAVGGSWVVGLQNDGTVAITGEGDVRVQFVVKGWSNIEEVAAGSKHIVGLKADGTVVATGNNEHGQCDVKHWRDIVSVVAGIHHTVGLKADGTVVTTEQNDLQRYNIARWRNIVSVAAGGNHTVGLKADGTVVATGEMDVGQCNVAGWRNIVAVAAGYNNTVGLKADGTVVAVGYNSGNQCEVGTWTGIVEIEAGTVGLKADGTMVSTILSRGPWPDTPDNYRRKLADDEWCFDAGAWNNLIAVAYGGVYFAGLKADGTVVVATYEIFRKYNVQNWKIRLPGPPPKNFAPKVPPRWDWEKKVLEGSAVAAGDYHTVCLKSDGTVVATGMNHDNQCDVRNWTNIIAVAAGRNHTVGLRGNGMVIATGSNKRGQCNVGEWTNIISIAAGGEHTVGLRADGTVVAVGDNSRFQCEVRNWKDIIAISAGCVQTVGLKADGTLAIAGNKNYHECAVTGWKNIAAVAASNGYTMGLKNDGTVIATEYWGKCDVGTWGEWNKIIAIAGEAECTVGLKADGTVVAIYKDMEECDVSGWRDIVAVAVGCAHIVGLKSDGTVVATGSNLFGQCNVQGWKLRLPEK